MSAFERVHAFIDARRPDTHTDTRTLNLVTSSLRAWERYYTFLNTIRARYEQASEIYTDAAQHQQASLMNHGQSGPKEMSKQDWEEFDRVNQLGDNVHLEIESFYIFANILLDRIASTFGYYFLRKPTWNHRQLTTNFEKVCIGKSLKAPAPDLLKMAGDLDKHIVPYRNKLIEHVEDPRLNFGMAWGQGTKARILTSLIYPSSHDEAMAFQKITGDLDQILQLLNGYMTEMLDFFDANSEKSVLPPSTSAAEVTSS